MESLVSIYIKDSHLHILNNLIQGGKYSCYIY